MVIISKDERKNGRKEEEKKEENSWDAIASRSRAV